MLLKDAIWYRDVLARYETKTQMRNKHILQRAAIWNSFLRSRTYIRAWHCSKKIITFTKGARALTFPASHQESIWKQSIAPRPLILYCSSHRFQLLKASVRRSSQSYLQQRVITGSLCAGASTK